MIAVPLPLPQGKVCKVLEGETLGLDFGQSSIGLQRNGHDALCFIWGRWVDILSSEGSFDLGTERGLKVWRSCVYFCDGSTALDWSLFSHWVSACGCSKVLLGVSFTTLDCEAYLF